MSKSLTVLEALLAEGIKKQMGPHRRYLAAQERAAIAMDAAAVAIAALIDLTGGPHHIIWSDGDTFTMQHPLTERLTGDLFDCTVHQKVAAGAPLPKGTYQVIATEDRPTDFDLTPMKEIS